jgi:signal transduction histidine kinase
VRVVLEAAELRIQDTGAGIPGVARERVFERHYRGQGSSGSGIGLSLVKRVCERYGWRVSLESEPGRGTSIRLLLSAPEGTAPA